MKNEHYFYLIFTFIFFLFHSCKNSESRKQAIKKPQSDSLSIHPIDTMSTVTEKRDLDEESVKRIENKWGGNLPDTFGLFTNKSIDTSAIHFFKEQLHKIEKVRYQEGGLFFEFADSLLAFNGFELWVVPNCWPMYREYLLLLVDKNKDIKDVYPIEKQWFLNKMDVYSSERFRLLKSKKRYFLTDVNKDNIFDFVLIDQQKNGNVYFASVQHVFSFENSKIYYWGSVESIGYLPVEDSFLVRHYRDGFNGNVQVFLKKNVDSGDSTLVGSYSVKFKDSKIIYTNKVIFDNRFDKVLYSTKMK